MGEVSIEKITYEDCGLCGGRSVFKAGETFVKPIQADYIDFLRLIINTACDEKNELFYYDFARVAVVIIKPDGNFDMIYTYNGNEKEREYYFFQSDDFEIDTKYPDIGELFTTYGIQCYGIFREKDGFMYEGLCGMPYSTDDDKQRKGFQIFRGLDLRGKARIKSVEFYENFHNYVRYNLSNEYYIEAYDTEDDREFWLCRTYADKKYMFIHFDKKDDVREYGLFEEEFFYITQENIELILNLSEDLEWVYIDNDFNLTSKLLEKKETE